MAYGTLGSQEVKLTLPEKILSLNWGMMILICCIAAIGTAMLYSAAGGSWTPWASRHVLRFGMGLVAMIAVALIDIRFWLRIAYLLYGLSFLLLLAVDIVGLVGGGARRWIDIGFMQLQPSEVVKVTMVLALARYFHAPTLQEVGQPLRLIPPILIVIGPTVLVLQQPDLGTALMLVAVGGAVFFVAGVRLWKFAVVIGAIGAAVPLAWQALREYQRNRILTFLDPERDPLGAGYHILQSQIALGAGGLWGRGWMQGSQSHLNFLPEKHTDFVFTMLAEEFGLVGGLTLLAIFVLVFLYGLVIALRSRSHFGRILALGLTANLFLYVFINMAMVMNLLPVVGVPLPLVSYGGTAMLSVMVGLGLVMCVFVHRDTRISRRATEDGYWTD